MANVNFNGQSASGGATSLNQLTDVTITSPSDDQVLTYDNGDWVNKAVPSPTVPDDLNDLDDVNITTPSNGQIFKYNGTSSKWENANPPTIPDSADDISYDNTTSGLTAVDVQAAIDEIVERKFILLNSSTSLETPINLPASCLNDYNYLIIQVRMIENDAENGLGNQIMIPCIQMLTDTGITNICAGGDSTYSNTSMYIEVRNDLSVPQVSYWWCWWNKTTHPGHTWICKVYGVK